MKYYLFVGSSQRTDYVQYGPSLKVYEGDDVALVFELQAKAMSLGLFPFVEYTREAGEEFVAEFQRRVQLLRELVPLE